MFNRTAIVCAVAVFISANAEANAEANDIHLYILSVMQRPLSYVESIKLNINIIHVNTDSNGYLESAQYDLIEIGL